MDELKREIKAFIAERDWAQFHSAKNLTTALVVEAAELAEHFQWLTPEQGENLPPEKLAEVRDEVADVLVYLLEICDKFNIDPVAAARAKMIKNAEKYPAHKVRGKALKYTEYKS